SEASKWRPFCSERCRLIDLGDWLDESHRISEPLDDHSEKEYPD
ncbi:MAG: DNA gyrase inhibitor YacG, partial [Candidatus Thiodiazotropha sp. (ex Lucinoma borealis)]|nr:DNA gyrase inhibitor YacG [Candidatus Thiodiazotropha sp. (ex Lucinoma borealis)]